MAVLLIHTIFYTTLEDLQEVVLVLWQPVSSHLHLAVTVEDQSDYQPRGAEYMA